MSRTTESRNGDTNRSRSVARVGGRARGTREEGLRVARVAWRLGGSEFRFAA